MATVTFTNHTAEHGPGDVVTVSEDEAARLCQASMARPATEDEVKAAAQAALVAAQQAEEEAAKAAEDAEKELAAAKGAKK